MAILYTNPNGTQFVDTADAGGLSKRIISMETSADFQAVGDALPNPDLILKNSGEKIDVYEKLEYDDQVSAGQEQVCDGVKALSIDITPNKAPKGVIKACELWLSKINIPNFIDQSVGGRWYGYQPLELRWIEYQGTSLPLLIDALPQKWFAFDLEGRLLFKSKVKQDGEPVEESNPRKFIVAKHRATYANPYGRGALAKCFWPVTFKKGGVKFWTYFLEKYGMPWTVIKVPSNTSDDIRESLLVMGKRMIQDAVAVINDTDQLEYKEASSKGASADLYKAYLQYFDAAISKAIVGQTATTEGTPGSLGNEEERGKVLARGIWSAASMIEEVINQIFAWIAEVNAASDRAPEAKFYARDEVQKSRAERDQIFVNMGVPLNVRYIAEKYFIDENHLATDDLDQPLKSSAPAVSASTPTKNSTAGLMPATEDAQQTSAVDDSDAFADMPDEDAIDLLLESMSDEEYQSSIETVLTPVFRLINSSKSFAEVERNLAGLYPTMSTEKLQASIGKLMFLSQIVGRQEVVDEERE